ALLRRAGTVATNQGESDPIMALGKARQFLRQQAGLLALDDPDDSLTLEKQTLDKLNTRHLKFKQTIGDVPVWGKEIIVHLDAGGEVYQLNGSYLPDGFNVATVPSLSEVDAIEAVKAELGGRVLNSPQASLLVYHDENTAPVLAWQVNARPSLREWFYYFVDATDGSIIHRVNNIHHGSVASSTGKNLFGDTVSFNSWQQDGNYFLLDPTFPLNDVSSDYDPVRNGLNSKGDTIVLDANNTESDLYFITNASNAPTGWDPTAVSVMQNAKIVYDYYLSTHNRKSLDNNNMNLQSIVRFGQNMANAFWNGQFMVYGDGDGKILGPLASCLDVAAHEMTHGVIQHSANLIYENQSGALNESFADVFAILIDDDDWLLGEDCTLASPGYTRSMQNPNSGLTYQPKTFSDYRNLPNTEDGDWGGVHINSGIPNHAFYLTAQEIGRPDTGKIYYRALTTYLTSSSTFIDAREALEQSATDLFGNNSAQHRAVSAAWAEVEVTGESSASRPTVTDPVDGAELLVYLRPADQQVTSADLYRQTVSESFNGYDAASDLGPLNSVPVLPTTPSVITDQSGTYISYVGTDLNLYVIQPGENAVNKPASDSGTIRTAAISPNGRYIAWTSALASDDAIHVVDLSNSSSADYRIELPTYQQESTSQAATVRFADSLNFDYTSEKIVFDVLLCTSLPDNQCQAALDTGYNFWSIGTLDIAAGGKFSFPFPSQSPTVSLGYPKFASNNNFVSIMDVVSYDTETGLFDSGAYTYNFETQTLAPVARLSSASQEFYTSPSFWGGDNYATFAYPDLERARYVAARVAVSQETDWTGSGNAIELNPNYTITPTMHRAGVRVVNRDLQLSRTQLDFGNVAQGNSKAMALTLSNTGNSDIEINNISITNDYFRHNGTNGRLPRGATMDITVTFEPGDAKDYAANLIIDSSGDPGTLSVSLSGSNPQGSGSVGNGSSGGGGGTPLALLFVLAAVAIRRFTGCRR
ncbi:MAG: M4 family metallopeptidase, partial [Gammaproteobacteria bacterium]|nr:M4 family metallopeptidase [Gammaproteobacteria bacterium]